MSQSTRPDPTGTLTGLWMPILVSWHRKAEPLLERLGIRVCPSTLRSWVLSTRIISFAGDKGGSGFTSCYGPAGEERLFIEYSQELEAIERERTVAHEFAHVLSIAGGRGPNHHEVWKKIVEAMGYPEEAERTWIDRNWF